MIAWLIYSALVSMLVAAAAMAVDGLMRLGRRATRWVWLAAMVVSVALVAFAPLRWSEMPASPVVTATVTPTSAIPTAPTWSQAIATTLTAAQRVLDAPLLGGSAWIQRRIPASAPVFVVGAWLVASALLAVVFGLVQVRFGRARRRWPLTELHGSRVRLSPNAGPVVVGLTRPEIVVPRWMLERTSAEQRVVIAHEAEHVRALDPWVLAGGWAALVTMPWNPALWFMLSRLRLAVELDCDARVLRGGVAPKTYGDLLIDLAERAAPLRLATTALADDSSHLAQRILAMKPPMYRFAFVRAAAVGAVGIASLVAACSTALPTDADIKKMDAGSAEGAARQLALVAATDSVRFVVDGEQTSAQRAKAIPADRIASVEVAKMNGQGTIAIRTKALEGELARPERDSVRLDGTGLIVRSQKAGVASPIFFIDGVRVDQATFSKLDRSRIAQVDVIKGAAAAAAYGPDAAAGAIVVKTLPR
jgi:beta-lactamase regulating signal transducer with metallopeptidase domain